MSLTSHILLMRQALTQGQQALLPALAQLYVQSHPDAAIAHCDVAWVHMQGHSLGAAHLHLQNALTLKPNCTEALDGLCELHTRMNQEDVATRWGKASLDAKHTQACGQADAISTACQQTIDPSLLRVVSFSLFGDDAFYAESAVRNAALVRQFYPDWQCRFYVDAALCTRVKQRLMDEGAYLLEPEPALRHLPGTAWRFLAIADTQVGTALFRDVDSPISTKERDAVMAWLDSRFHTHLMRDHVLHSELMLAGLWGTRCAGLRSIDQAMHQWFTAQRHHSHADQHFLRFWVWPRVWQSVLQHDAHLRWHTSGQESSKDFPCPMPVDSAVAHVGQALFETVRLQADAPQATQLFFSLNDNQSTQPLGHYRVVRSNEGFVLRLPPAVRAALDSGTLHIQITAAK